MFLSIVFLTANIYCSLEGEEVVRVLSHAHAGSSSAVSEQQPCANACLVTHGQCRRLVYFIMQFRLSGRAGEFSFNLRRRSAVLCRALTLRSCCCAVAGGGGLVAVASAAGVPGLPPPSPGHNGGMCVAPSASNVFMGAGVSFWGRVWGAPAPQHCTRWPTPVPL